MYIADVKWLCWDVNRSIENILVNGHVFENVSNFDYNLDTHTRMYAQNISYHKM